MALATQGRGDGDARPQDQAPQQRVTRSVPGRCHDRLRRRGLEIHRRVHFGQQENAAVAIHKSTKSTGRRSVAPRLIWGAQRRRPVGPRGVVDGVTRHVDDMQST